MNGKTRQIQENKLNRMIRSTASRPGSNSPLRSRRVTAGERHRRRSQLIMKQRSRKHTKRLIEQARSIAVLVGFCFFAAIVFLLVVHPELIP